MVVTEERMKVVVSAYACEPGHGSEPEVGWQWVLQLSRFYDVWVFTRENNRAAIEASGMLAHHPSLHVQFYDLPRWLRFWKKGGRGVHLYYSLWQWGAWWQARRLHRRHRFSFSHHVTFSAMYHFPVFSLLPIPFVWGPVGGGEFIPAPFVAGFQGRHRLREGLRHGLRLATRFNPLFHLACHRSRLILAATEASRAMIPRRFQDRVVLEAQIGMPGHHSIKDRTNTGEPIQFITASRHVYWKGIDLLLHAFRRYLDAMGPERARLTILGRGPRSADLQALCHHLGLDGQVVFTSHLPTREMVLDAFARADVFVYGSLLECAGSVVLEALAMGTPVICLDLPGPGEIVDDRCGIRVTGNDPEEAIAGLARAMMTLTRDRGLLARLTEGTRTRVEGMFLWHLKGERLRSRLERRPPGQP
ncbi:MAG: glycosyltransferase family 4 protein [Magnetococcales bacterium]|nr:glycosyltransferase family 4 protein [Magnetococcales bacterium]MBF0151903.1 glycosyltransferase family 4 protein [Magnetococcales bacterium]MBF0632186.1 glycosyltransferase family 4 protein [Magnetococcales bacterium]